MKKMVGCMLLFSLFGCSSKEEGQRISADDALLKISQGAVLLDVREPDEYLEGHIEHSVNLPLGNIEETIVSAVTSNEQEIIVYCRSGARSKQASHRLLEKGYTKVYDLGGILSWPYEIKK